MELTTNRPTEADIADAIALHYTGFRFPDVGLWQRLAIMNYRRFAARAGMYTFANRPAHGTTLQPSTPAGNLSREVLIRRQHDLEEELISIEAEVARLQAKIDLYQVEADGHRLALEGLSDDAAFEIFIRGVQSIWSTIDLVDVAILLTICKLFFPGRLEQLRHNPNEPIRTVNTLIDTRRLVFEVEAGPGDAAARSTACDFQTAIEASHPEFRITNWLDCRSSVWRNDMAYEVDSRTTDGVLYHGLCYTEGSTPRSLVWEHAIWLPEHTRVVEVVQQPSAVRDHYVHALEAVARTIVDAVAPVGKAWYHGQMWPPVGLTTGERDTIARILVSILHSYVSGAVCCSAASLLDIALTHWPYDQMWLIGPAYTTLSMLVFWLRPT